MWVCKEGVPAVRTPRGDPPEPAHCPPPPRVPCCTPRPSAGTSECRQLPGDWPPPCLGALLLLHLGAQSPLVGPRDSGPSSSLCPSPSRVACSSLGETPFLCASHSAVGFSRQGSWGRHLPRAVLHRGSSRRAPPGALPGWGPGRGGHGPGGLNPHRGVGGIVLWEVTGTRGQRQTRQNEGLAGALEPWEAFGGECDGRAGVH